MDYNMKKTGERIRNLRKERDLTQEEAAAELMVDTRAYGRIERGERGASVDILIAIASFYGVSLDYLILGKEPQEQLVRQQIHRIAQQMNELEKLL